MSIVYDTDMYFIHFTNTYMHFTKKYMYVKFYDHMSFMLADFSKLQLVFHPSMDGQKKAVNTVFLLFSGNIGLLFAICLGITYTLFSKFYGQKNSNLTVLFLDFS